jgi:uncharacterized protein Yka (UPF0111/DUF47 family)
VTRQLITRHADEIRRYAELLLVHGSITPAKRSETVAS